MKTTGSICSRPREPGQGVSKEASLTFTQGFGVGYRLLSEGSRNSGLRVISLPQLSGCFLPTAGRARCAGLICREKWGGNWSRGSQGPESAAETRWYNLTSAVRQNGFLFKRGKIRTAKRELHSNRPPQKMAAQELRLAAEQRKVAKDSEVLFHEIANFY